MAFSPPVVGCLVEKGLQMGGGHGHRRTPLATPLVFLGFIFQSPLLRSIFRSGILKYRNWPTEPEKFLRKGPTI